MKKKLFPALMICVVLMAVACGKKTDTESVTSMQPPKNAPVVEQEAENPVTTETIFPTIGVNPDLPKGESDEDWDEITASQSNTAEQDYTTNESEDTIAPTAGKTESATEATTPVETPTNNEGCGCAYANYLQLSPAQQQEYMGTFSSPMAFIEWCKAAEAEHASHVTIIEASGDVLDIGDYIP